MIALALALALATAQPTYLVERIATAGQSSRRVSVFRDGTAVVALREGLGEPTIIRDRLQGPELRVLLQVLGECYDDLSRVRPSEYAPGESWVEWRVALPERAPLLLRLPQSGTPLAVVLRMAQALDGVENRLITEPAGREDLSQWIPAKGDRVVLLDGRAVEVRWIGDSSAGVIVSVVVIDNPLGQVFTLDDLRRQAVRRVAK